MEFLGQLDLPSLGELLSQFRPKGPGSGWFTLEVQAPGVVEQGQALIEGTYRGDVIVAIPVLAAFGQQRLGLVETLPCVAAGDQPRRQDQGRRNHRGPCSADQGMRMAPAPLPPAPPSGCGWERRGVVDRPDADADPRPGWRRQDSGLVGPRRGTWQ